MTTVHRTKKSHTYDCDEQRKDVAETWKTLARQYRELANIRMKQNDQLGVYYAVKESMACERRASKASGDSYNY